MTDATLRGVRSAQLGLLANTGLAIVKLVAGLIGHSYALVADAIESSADVLASLVVWGGLRMAGRHPDEDYPFGYGKAEPLAASVVSLMLLGAAIAIASQSIDEIRTPHTTPAPWTLAVLIAVLGVKWLLAKRTDRVGEAIGSTAVRADARHHLSDALTSAAAFVGITIAVLGGPGWESADDWAALAASLVIAWNGWSMLRPALDELMDRSADAAVVAKVEQAARAVPGVLDVEKLALRKAGVVYRITLHVQTHPQTPLDEAHRLGGRVKGAIQSTLPEVQSVLVHMEPYEPSTPTGPR